MAERYEIRGRLGRGGMSAVYRAFDSVMGREVAVKRLLPIEETNLNEEAGEVLASEAAALARFQHPNIVTVFAFEEDEEGPYVVMELVDGMDLHEVLQDGALSLGDFEDIAIQCLEPLVSASELSLLHRDIKPGNIMLTMTASERFLVKILDFGLAKFSQQPSTQTLDQAGSFLGSIDYIAPEQLELQPLDQRTDLYSLGCVFYYALSQKAPFSGDNPAETSMNHLNHVVVPIRELRPDLSEPVSNWLMGMVSREPKDRPSDALDALESFRRAIQEKEEEVPVAIPVAEEASTGKSPRILTGKVEPTPKELKETGTGKRPILNTSPQVPRTKGTASITSRPRAPENGRSLQGMMKNPALVTLVGVFLLAVFLVFLFRGRDESRTEPQERDETIAVVAPTQEEAESPEKPGFQMPDPFDLEAESKPSAGLPDTPIPLLRFAAAEGLLDASLTPVTGDGAEVGIWVNLQTRKKWRSLFPMAGDPYLERLPSRVVLNPAEIPALQNPTPSLAFGNREGLVSRGGALPLEKGFTLFFVGKINEGSGRQVFIEPNNGGSGALASVRIDFSGNVIGASRMGAATKESVLQVAWADRGIGVIAYGCSPSEGRHRILALPATKEKPEITEGSFPVQPSPFQKLILGGHDPQAVETGSDSIWVLEFLLYDRLLFPRKMEEIARALSEFHFRLPAS